MDKNTSECLDKISNDACREIEALPQMQAMLSGKINSDQYVKFLFKLYPIVLNFCPVMAIAAGNSLGSQYDHLKKYFFDHLIEELGHEQLVLSDINSFDVAIDNEILDRFPSPPIQAMLAFNQGLAISNPYGVLGMIYVLEMMACFYGGRVADAVSKVMCRQLANGFTFLSSHAELDMDHFEKTKKYINSIENKKYRQSILNAVKMNFYFFKNIISSED